MKIKILIFFLLVLSLNAQSISQNSSSSAFANLIVPLSISASYGNLDFGEIILTKTQFQKNISPLSGQLFIITGQPGRGVSINYSNITITNSSILSTPLGTVTTIPFIPQVVLDNGTPIKNGQMIPLASKGTIGELRLWVGGTIQIDPNQSSGLYSGLFTITVSY